MYIHRKKIAGLFIIILFLIARPTYAQSSSVTPELRVVLLAQLQSLLIQVAQLQQQLADRHAAAKIITYSQEGLYPTDYFSGTYESAYAVQGTSINPIITSAVRTGDQVLFDTFRELAGDAFVQEHLSEFRIFTNKETQLGAFVQQKMDGSWILGINRFDKELLTSSTQKGMTDILLHEYAHILFFEEGDIATDFEEEFWSNALMKQHTKDTGSLTNVNTRIQANSVFYKKYQSLFISEYAASTMDEDLVESFTYFVMENKPTGSTEAIKKVLFFYRNDQMVKLRKALRTSTVLTF